MRKIATILTGLLIFLPLTAQRKPQYAPLNPEYLRYIEANENGTLKNETSDGYKLEYIPSPLYLHFRERNNYAVLKSTPPLPVTYNLRDLGLVTPVKDQGGGSYGGNCVAFATMGSIESRWLMTGNGEYDLSEQNIAACYGYLWGYGKGANHQMAAAYLSRLSGPVLESQDPYNLKDHPCKSNLEPVALVPESRWLPRDNDLIKQAIIDYGGIFCSVYITDRGFNELYNTYLYTGTAASNHAWLVVGWDNNKLVPDANKVGAWIIKNSWGSEWMDSGYVYCSYADSRIMSDVAYYPERWDNKKVDTIYLYDYLGAISSSGYGEYIAYGLAKYTAPEEQLITKIGTFINSEGTILDIEIWDDFDGEILSGLLNSKYNVYKEFPGFYTFDLPTYVNDDFYIKIKYYTPGFEYPIPIEQFINEYADPVIDTSVNWISPDGINWNSCNPDSTDDGENLTIRAYAVNLNSPMALFESNKEKVCLESSVLFTFLENDTVTSYNWNFGKDASPATADTRGPHNVIYSSEGHKTISLSVEGPNGTDTLVRYDYINVIDNIEVFIPESSAKIPVGMPFKITAFGADNYLWQPDTYLDKNWGQTVTATPVLPGEYKYVVTGYQGSCFDSATFTLSAKVRPMNDNICDALEIYPGGWIGTYPGGEFLNNINATKEPNEPAPPEGKCTDPMHWCDEGGVQNSVWFWFTATSHGIVSFDTEGFDQQIAIYRADTCADILDKNYTLVAANDDYYPKEKLYACALESVTVMPGKKYFVQIDGSAGGTEGYFSMIFWDYYLGVDENKESSGLEIYPNPGTGIFNFRIDNPSSQSTILEVFSPNGQAVLKQNYEIRSGMFESSFDLTGNPPGIYMVRFISGGKVIHEKVILQ